jgi:U3 small nucleolar RNA-associated protein 20
LGLLKVLRPLLNLVEKNSKDLLPFFFELTGGRSSTEDDMQVDDLSSTQSKSQVEVSKSARAAIIEFLQIFENLRNPTALYKATELYQTLCSLLANGESKIQQLALNSILTWKEPGVVAYADHLRGLTNDEKFRDFLSTWDIEAVNNNVKIHHQPALVNVLIRVLYGKLINRRGRGSSKAGLKARRNAIFSFIVGLDDAAHEQFFELMVSPFASILESPDVDNDGIFHLMTDGVLACNSCVLRHKVGFVNVLEDMIKQLRNCLVPVIPRILKVLLYIINGTEHDMDVDAHSDDSVGEEHVGEPSGRQQKSLRQASIRRLTELFSLGAEFNYDPYIPCMYTIFLDSRIPNFNTENTQAPSAVMELFVAWAKNKNYALYLTHSKELMRKVVSTLTSTGVKESVVSAILEMLESIISLDREAESTVFIDGLIRPNIDDLLEHFQVLFLTAFSTGNGLKTYNTPTRMIGILSEIAECVDTPDVAEKLMLLLLPCLKKSPRAVPFAVKSRILDILEKFLPHLPSLKEAERLAKTPYYVTVANMFSTLSDRVNRTKLVAIFKLFISYDEKLSRIAPVIEGLNAFSTMRIDEPDFNARFDALNSISQDLYSILTPDEWLPVLHNLLFLVQDSNEFSIRTSSAFCLTQFIEVAAQPKAESECVDQVVHVVFPIIKKGLRAQVEIVRQELIQLLGCIVKNIPKQPEFADLVCLLADGDEEASFFTNIYHLQIHRRIRAMGRLSEACKSGEISSANAGNIFIPMLTKTIFECDRIADHRIINESIITIAACSSCLSWGKYYEIIKTFMKSIPRRADLEKELIRVVVAILDYFHFDMTAAVSQPIVPAPVEDKKTEGPVDNGTAQDGVESDDEGEANEDGDDNMDVDGKEQEKAQQQSQRVFSTVTNKLIPDLFNHLSTKTENNLNLRVPVAISIASLLKRMPVDAMEAQLPKLLTTLCQFLRSRLQDVRDGCREALSRIAKDIGPKYFHFIVRELQGALQKGYQLHVLGYTLHYLLVHVTDDFPHGFLHSSLSMVVNILVNDIFGSLSEEREAEELQGKLKEMKNTKSFDSYELVSTVIDLEKVEILLLPLKEIMMETASLKTTRKLDESLQRVSQGLMRNEAIDTKGAMIFIHGLVTENLSLSQIVSHTEGQKSNLEKNYVVQLKRKDATKERIGYFKANAYKFVEFGLSLLLGAIKKDKLTMKSHEHLQMLDPLVEPLGKSMFSKHATIPIAAIRVLCQISKWPLPSLEKTMLIVVRRSFELIAKGNQGNSELTHAVFRLLSVVVRDCNYIDINQKQLVTLISLLTPDLEEPHHQATTFSLIRAILGRKFVFPEIYDLMQTVCKLSVTSQSQQVRELCRQAYLQFFLDYPHGPVRLRKQMNYIVRNLKYEFESGRESMLLLLSSLIEKVTDEVLFDFAELMFLSLVVSLINDESAKCREITASVIKALLTKLDSARRSTIIAILDGWFDKLEEPTLLRMAAQVYGLLLESVENVEGRKLLRSCCQNLSKILSATVQEFESFSDSDLVDLSDLTRWEAGYYALNTFSKILKIYNLQALDYVESMWQHVSTLLLYPHAWIRSICSKIYGYLFGSLSTASLNHQELFDTLNLPEISYRFCVQLASEHLTEEHATQIVKNLLFVGRQFIDAPAVNTITSEQDGQPSKSPLLRIFTKLSHMAREEIGTSNKLLMVSLRGS